MILPPAGTDLDGIALTNVLAALMADKAKYASTAAAQTRSNNAFGDLATAGPSVSLTSQGTLAWVFWGCIGWGAPGGAAAAGFVAVDISVGTTMAANVANGYYGTENAGTGPAISAGIFRPYTINAGVSNTYTLKYKNVAAAGTANFQDRWILVIAP